MSKWTAITCFLSLALTGCATPQTNFGTVDPNAVAAEVDEQQGFLLQTIVDDTDRLFRLAEPLFQAAAEICRPQDVGLSFGMFDATSLSALPKEFRAGAQRRLGVTELATLTSVGPQSPMARAGLKAGDQILSVAGKPVPPGRRALETLDELIKQHFNVGSVAIGYRRDGVDSVATVALERLPRYLVTVDPTNEINAFADGQRIVFLRGLMRFINSDDALTMVMAHELAHNCQSHIPAKTQNSAIGTIVDLLAAAGGVDTGGAFEEIGTLAYSADFEREADYVGLYYIARAGGATDKARDAYRMLSSETMSGLTATYGSTHPSNPERFIRMRETEREIANKMAAGLQLRPELKKK